MSDQPLPTAVPAEGPPDLAAFQTAVAGEVIEAKDAPVPTEILPVAVPAPTHHVIVGLGTLAAMSDAEYEAKKAELQRGMARMRDIVGSILVEGEDYGKVSGIDRPFLHQPGAEKLANFYGLVVRQDADRITRGPDDDPKDVPPFAYHVRSYVHLGSFDGPIVAQGYGEANPYEERYRYRWQNPTCPECGHELIKRKSPAQLAGKWNCPNFGGKGGCNRVYEPNDERIKPRQQVENPDLWGLAETIIQMAGKRSMVASIRRATGTSGLFTQDDDSPSVRQQSAAAGGESGAPEPEPPIEAVKTAPVARGAKVEVVSDTQLLQLSKLAAERGLKPQGVANAIERVTGLKIDVGEGERAEQSGRLVIAIRGMTAEAVGKVIHALDTGEVPEQQPDPVTAATAPSKATN